MALTEIILLIFGLIAYIALFIVLWGGVIRGIRISYKQLPEIYLKITENDFPKSLDILGRLWILAGFSNSVLTTKGLNNSLHIKHYDRLSKQELKLLIKQSKCIYYGGSVAAIFCCLTLLINHFFHVYPT